jgi:hypothetical protein
MAIADVAWRSSGACQGLDAEIFYPENEDHVLTMRWMLANNKVCGVEQLLATAAKCYASAVTLHNGVAQ